MNESRIQIGCIADDYTGASDAASFLVKGGLQTVLLNDIPDASFSTDGLDAVVIGMKIRSVPPAEAVSAAMAAMDRLLEMGARQIYYKYCSTFDSTPAGNIGPVMDALADALDEPYTLLCPSLPANGRTVAGGRLFVYGVPLHESPMKDHPLNPMWDDRIAVLMEPQSQYTCYTIPVTGDPAADERALGRVTADASKPYYLVPDYETDEQGREIARRFGHLRLLSGGSGLLEHLGALAAEGRPAGEGLPGVEGRGILLCGSCSKATQGQIRWYQEQGGPSIPLDPAKVADGTTDARRIYEQIRQMPDNVLVYSVGAMELKEENRALYSSLVERTLSELASLAMADGVRRIIVAGGETSGAITRELGLDRFRIGRSIAPGVPLMAPTEHPEIRIVLKSGNFGQEDFFGRAVRVTSGKEETP